MSIAAPPQGIFIFFSLPFARKREGKRKENQSAAFIASYRHATPAGV